MKIRKVTSLSTAKRVFKSKHYLSAKKTDIWSALALIDELNIDYSVFANFKGFVCPVQKSSGNKIPLALAIRIAENSPAIFYDHIKLLSNRAGNEMIIRMNYIPVYAGTALPGKYIIVDDYYTTGQTLIHLKSFIESFGCNVVNAYTLTCNKRGNYFEPTSLELRLLRSKFPSISNAFDISTLTRPQLEYIMRFSSLTAFYSKYIEVQNKRFA